MTAPKEYGEYNMGETAEKVAERYHISREEQDQWAVESHLRASRAWDEGRFCEEVIPYPLPNPKGTPILFEKDETIRVSTIEELSKLPTLFKEGGTVTAASSSPFTDGAAAVVVMSRDKAEKLGLESIARVVATASVGVEPAYMGIGPVPATRKVLKNSGLNLKQIDLLEINEAFAAQVVACCKELGLEREKVNVNGSGISLGRPNDYNSNI
jgi:acetyl-CoA acetyltransferase family protein